MARHRRLVISSLLLSLAVIACGGRAPEPARPDRSLVPDAAAVADRWEALPCGGVRFTLRPGSTVDVVLAGADQQACPGQTPTPILLGQAQYATNGASPGEPWASGAPLILTGADGNDRWWATIGNEGADCIRFPEGAGAYLEGETLHLSTGLVLSLSPDFAVPDYPPDPYPLRQDDLMCLDEQGRVVSIDVWIPY